MASKEAAQAAGLLAAFWNKVAAAVYAAGGTDEHLARVATSEADQAIARFAKDLVGTIGYVSFKQMIAAGGFHLWGFAEHPGDIKGQVCHRVTRETRLDRPGQVLTTSGVLDRYGHNMADLSELLDFGMKFPKIQSEYSIGIAWRDEAGEYWAAVLVGDTGYRGLRIAPDTDGSGVWSINSRFLVGK